MCLVVNCILSVIYIVPLFILQMQTWGHRGRGELVLVYFPKTYLIRVEEVKDTSHSSVHSVMIKAS